MRFGAWVFLCVFFSSHAYSLNICDRYNPRSDPVQAGTVEVCWNGKCGKCAMQSFNIPYVFPQENVGTAKVSFSNCWGTVRGESLKVYLRIASPTGGHSYLFDGYRGSSFPTTEIVGYPGSIEISFDNSSEFSAASSIGLGRCKIQIDIDDLELSDAGDLELVQLEQFLDRVNRELPMKADELAKWLAKFTNQAGSEEEMYCLIEQNDDPLYKTPLVESLKAWYANTYGRSYNSVSFQCPASVSLREVVRRCRINPLSKPECASYKLYENAKQWFVDSMRKLSSMRYYDTPGELGDEANDLYRALREALSEADNIRI